MDNWRGLHESCMDNLRVFLCGFYRAKRRASYPCKIHAGHASYPCMIHALIHALNLALIHARIHALIRALIHALNRALNRAVFHAATQVIHAVIHDTTQGTDIPRAPCEFQEIRSTTRRRGRR